MGYLRSFEVVVCGALLSAAAGCTPEGPGRRGVRSYGPSSRVASSAPAARRLLDGPPPAGAPRYRSADLPGGITCLLRLKALEIAYRPLPSRGEMVTPVELTGPLRGLRFRATGKRRLVCDCRFALALHRAAPLFLRLGLQELIYSNAYSSRHPSPGKLSRHDMGLAIDVHRFVSDGQVLRVEDDFQRGASPICGEAPTALNALACYSKDQRLFDRVLTPDTNAAHYNHFHLAILSLDRRRFRKKRRPPPLITD